MADGGVEDDGGGQTRLGDLPESCVAEIVRRLEPEEICRLAKLSRAFRGAAMADFVWEEKLPRNYEYLMERAFGEKKDWVGKRDLFARLCRRSCFDGEFKEFWLEKCNGQICMAISSKALYITGIDDRRYWNYIPSTESRFHQVAYVTQTWWLEVGGEEEFCFPEGEYSLFFRLHLGRVTRRFCRRACSFEHVRGWDKKPVMFQFSTSDGQLAQSKYYLVGPGTWLNYHVGDFVAKSSSATIKVKFSMKQIDCTHNKGGLTVDSVFIWPKNRSQEMT